MAVKLVSYTTRLWDFKAHLTSSDPSFVYKTHSASFAFCCRKRVAVISVVTRLRPDNRGIVAGFTAGARVLLVHTGCGVHPATCLVTAGSAFLGGIAASTVQVKNG